MPTMLRDTLLNNLDDISSYRSSLSRRSRAFGSLEQLLAEFFVGVDPHQLRESPKVVEFLELQDRFECNIASRIITYISITLPVLKSCLAASSEDPKQAADATSIIQPLLQSLTVIQGLTLLHTPTKAFLERKTNIQLFVDLLTLCRHVASTQPLSPTTNTISTPKLTSPPKTTNATPPIPLFTSAILDTILCILVDSSPALRTFEECSGLEAVVKTLKRTGVSREVRMKCLEFLYFYLLPEGLEQANKTKAQTSPQTPTRTRHQDRSTIMLDNQLADELDLSVSFDESAIGSAPVTPPRQTNQSQSPKSSKPRQLAMLRKDVDFVPLSPKKTQVSRLGVSTPSKFGAKSRIKSPLAGPTKTSPLSKRSIAKPSLSPVKATPATPSRRTVTDKTDRSDDTTVSASSSFYLPNLSALATPKKSGFDMSHHPGEGNEVKTTAQKKEMLGAWLGNVDALVEGVQKAGVWGLG